MISLIVKSLPVEVVSPAVTGNVTDDGLQQGYSATDPQVVESSQDSLGPIVRFQLSGRIYFAKAFGGRLFCCPAFLLLACVLSVKTFC